MIAFIHLYQMGTCAWCVYQTTSFISLAEDRYFWKKNPSCKVVTWLHPSCWMTRWFLRFYGQTATTTAEVLQCKKWQHDDLW